MGLTFRAEHGELPAFVFPHTKRRFHVNRQDIEEKLKSQPWFQASSSAVQFRLLSLPGDLSEDDRKAKKPDQSCNGYLADLAMRPESQGGVKVRRILEVLIPEGRIFGIFTNIEVEVIKKPEIVFAYQYFSWRQGPQSGAKGMVLIRNKAGQFTHTVVLHGYSFGPAKNTPDLPGGFAEVNEAGIAGMLARFKTELCEELGVPDLKVAEVIPLGPFYSDRGMTNNHPELFAAIIDASEATKIPEGQYRNPDPYEMQFVPNIVPIGALWGPKGLLATSEDGYFTACAARLIGRGILGNQASTAVAPVTSLIAPIPLDKQDKRGWSVTLNGEHVPQVQSLCISNPKFGAVNYGNTPPGYDGWSFHEIGGGGSVIVPYASINKELWIGVLEQARHNQGGKVLNVPRGFIDPGESHFEAAHREFVEETGADPGSARVTPLPGESMNPNSAFFETPGEGEGVKCFAVQFHSRQLEPSDGSYVFRKGVIKATRAKTAAEQILGCRFIPYAKALQLGDMFTVAAVGRLIGSIGITPQ